MIEPADLTWQDGQPFARDFSDIYHAPEGAREVQRVFMGPAQIEGKAADAVAKGLTLRIGELGFGTGLNFAVAAAAALKAGCRLHFVSFDLRPIAPAAFAEIARQRRASWPIYAELERAYPPLLAGWHRRVFAEGRITLSLHWGEAGVGLADLASRQRQPIDAWFLDGFAPSRNPALWREDLLRQLAKLSAAGTSVATFSAAGAVRRRLEACGFNMRRVDQRPHKRESLAGAFAKPGLRRQIVPRRVTVAGAGISGASIARHLAEQGIAVEVFDPAECIASGASGIPRRAAASQAARRRQPERRLARPCLRLQPGLGTALSRFRGKRRAASPRAKSEHGEDAAHRHGLCGDRAGARLGLGTGNAGQRLAH